VIPTFTNMAWPDDPYGTGQLWRKEPQLLVGLSVCWTGAPQRAAPASYAVVYIRLHQTRPPDLAGSIAFGFRAAAAMAAGQVPELVRMLDLDILRARRLAKIVAGYPLARDLRALGNWADGGPGIRALDSRIGAGDDGNRHVASVVDLDGGRGSLEAELCGLSELVPPAVQTATAAFAPQQLVEAVAASAWSQSSAAAPAAGQETGRGPELSQPAEWLAACATERALICAVTVGCVLGRLTWHEPLDVGAVMTANAWDCFGSLLSDQVPVAP
jgi:hypothetical protein